MQISVSIQNDLGGDSARDYSIRVEDAIARAMAALACDQSLRFGVIRVQGTVVRGELRAEIVAITQER